MARLLVWNLVTLDGYFEGEKPWDLGWHPRGDELERLSLGQLHSAGGLLFGRKTYLGMADYWNTATGDIADLMNGLPKVVVSRSLERAQWKNSRVMANLEAVAKWKLQEEKDLFVFGSASLVDGLLEAGLVDEIRLGLVPVVLGGGTPHFKPSPRPRPMKLLEAKPLKRGGALLRLEPASR